MFKVYVVREHNKLNKLLLGVWPFFPQVGHSFTLMENGTGTSVKVKEVEWVLVSDGIAVDVQIFIHI